MFEYSFSIHSCALEVHPKSLKGFPDRFFDCCPKILTIISKSSTTCLPVLTALRGAFVRLLDLVCSTWIQSMYSFMCTQSGLLVSPTHSSSYVLQRVRYIAPELMQSPHLPLGHITKSSVLHERLYRWFRTNWQCNVKWNFNTFYNFPDHFFGQLLMVAVRLLWKVSVMGFISSFWPDVSACSFIAIWNGYFWSQMWLLFLLSSHANTCSCSAHVSDRCFFRMWGLRKGIGH